MHRLPVVSLASLLAVSALPAQILLTTNGTTDTVASFDPFNGALINASLFSIPNVAQVSAIDVNGEIWISEQVTTRITRRDLAGNILGTIGPALSPSGALSNIRGMCYAYGSVWVTNFASSTLGAVANSVVQLDTAGNHVNTFSVAGMATNPFAVIPFNGDLLVTGFSNNLDVYRFTVAGTPVGVFHDSTLINPAHGLARANDGNVWCASFTDDWLVKLDATTGAVLTQIPGGSTTRGVYELGNGNLLWTDGAGVHLYDVVTQQSSIVLAGSCYHLNLFGASGGSAVAMPYGTGCDGLVLAANSLPQIGNANFALLLTNVPAVSPVGLFGFGTQVVNPGLDLTVIGMPGCFGYSNVDLGLFTGSLVASGTSTVGLPIPNDPTLQGAALSTQGLSFSIATPLGLASSNGVSLVIGL